MGPMVTEHLLDARSRVHIPPALPAPPYTVMRTRTTVPLTASAAADTDVVMLVSEYTDAGQGSANILPLISVSGVGSNVPGTTETYGNAADISAIGNGNCHARLHSLTVTVQAPTSVNTTAGVFFLGTMPGNIFRTAFPSWNAVAQAITARLQAQQYTAYSAVTPTPPTVTSYPMDTTQWSMFDNLLVGGGAPIIRGTDSLAPIALVLKGGATQPYLVTICCEWRVIFALTDARSSLHEMHAPSTAGDVHRAAAAASDRSGVASSVASTVLTAAGHVAAGLAGAGFAGAVPFGRRLIPVPRRY